MPIQLQWTTMDYNGKNDFKEFICKPFCSFFRPGQKDAMACHAAEVVALLIEREILNPESLPLYGKASSLWDKKDSTLKGLVCDQCPFEAEDCDFQSESPPQGCEPCGGYILLKLLLETGMISWSVLNEVQSG